MKLSGFGSSDYVGIFMDFNIYRITESDNVRVNISYLAKEIAGTYNYRASQLESLIVQIIRHCYLSNTYHRSFIDSEYKNLLKGL